MFMNATSISVSMDERRSFDSNDRVIAREWTMWLELPNQAQIYCVFIMNIKDNTTTFFNRGNSKHFPDLTINGIYLFDTNSPTKSLEPFEKLLVLA